MELSGAHGARPGLIDATTVDVRRVDDARATLQEVHDVEVAAETGGVVSAALETPDDGGTLLQGGSGKE